MTVKISLITITYNSEKTIEDTLLSVVKQNCEDIEYIIVDGGSTDSTLDIIERYKRYVTVLISEPDKGISDAFNKGIKIATGDIIGIVNSDDFLAENAIRTILNIVENNWDYDVYYGNSIMFSEKGAYTYKPGGDLQKFPLYMVVSHPAAFVKKSAYEKYGKYSLDYKCAMDFELLSKMYCEGAKFKYVDEVLTYFRLGGVSKKKSLVTEEESCRIAIRNGIAPYVVKKWYRKIRVKSKVLDFLNKCGMENALRSAIKGQEKASTLNIKWFLER